MGWPVSWLFPYSIWTWVILFAPDVVRWVLQQTLDKRWSPVTARIEDGRVVLRNPDGNTLDVFSHADVETLTIISRSHASLGRRFSSQLATNRSKKR